VHRHEGVAVAGQQCTNPAYEAPQLLEGCLQLWKLLPWPQIRPAHALDFRFRMQRNTNAGMNCGLMSLSRVILYVVPAHETDVARPVVMGPEEKLKGYGQHA